MFSCPCYIRNKEKNMPLQAHCHKLCLTNRSKRAYKISSQKPLSEGSATVEASLVIPFFIMLIMTIYGMAGCIRLHNVIYEGLLETAEYMAEYQYLYSVAADGAGGITGDIVDTGVAVTKLKAYIDDEALVDKYVSGGSSGLIFSECRYDEDNGYIYLTLTYAYGIEIPFVGKLTKSRVEKIKQKAYVGYMSAGADDEASAYVYVAEYGDVYHTSRSCTHIKLSISQVNEAVLKQNYSGLTACEYCAQNHAKTGVIYVTDQGDRYHFSLSCTGLKRTVSRIKKNEAGNMTACSKCG